MQFIAKRIRIYYNKTRFKNITLKKENKVYLFTRNITTKKLNKKLNYKKIKLFKVKKSIKGISFKFDLSKIIKIYPVFYVLLFKLANKRTPVIKIPKKYIKRFFTYNVEEILNKQNINS